MSRNLAAPGVTLAELLLALALSAMLVLGAATLISVGQQVFAQAERTMDDIQTWQTFLLRLNRAMNGCYANHRFPGVLVVPTPDSGYQFPDTLVVWTPPNGQPADPDGGPRLNELIVFAPPWASPNELREYRLTGSSPAPSATDLTAWQSLLSLTRANTQSESILLTDRLRSFSVGNRPLGAIRFHLESRPSSAELGNANLDWEELSWPQGLYSPDSGQRRIRIHIEMQLSPSVTATSSPSEICRTFIGSIAFQYTIKKQNRFP